MSMPSMISSASARLQPRQRLGPVAAMDDQLADQAVVIGRDRVAAIERRIHPHAQAARRMEHP